jgi:hypothetical protein
MLLALLGLCMAPAWGQSRKVSVGVRSPLPDAVLGWGQDAPTVRIEATLQDQGMGQQPPRLFLTANVMEGARIVDGVRLYDDGSHGDAQPGDGAFTATYRAPKPGSYAIRVRGTWAAGAGQGAGEGWSQTVPFHVEQIPYPHIVYPEPGGKVGRQAELRARLLLASQPFTQKDPTLKAEAWTGSGVGSEAGGNRHEARRNGSLLTAPLSFTGLGKRQVGIAVSVERRGVRLEALADPITVDVAQPPVWALIAAAALFLAYLLLPPKAPVNLYEHRLVIRKKRPRGARMPAEREGADPAAAQTAVDAVIKPEGLEPVRKVIGGSGAGVDVPNAPGRLCTVTAEPGKKALIVRAGEYGNLAVPDGEKASATIRPGTTFEVGGYEFDYGEPHRQETRRFPRWLPNTRAKVMTLVLTVAMLGLGIWQYSQFFKQ